MQFILNEQAQKAMNTQEPIEGIGSSDGFWYSLTKGGYFKPEDVLSDPSQIQQVKDAVALLEALENVYNQVVEEF
jgi:hypothetical protein